MLRWETSVIEYGSNRYPSVDLKIARLYLDVPVESLGLNATETVYTQDTVMPTDHCNTLFFRYKLDSAWVRHYIKDIDFA